MVYSVSIRNLSYKKDLSSLDSLLDNQSATYAALRYCNEIPSQLYNSIMKQLACEADKIYDRKLKKLVKTFMKSTGCVILMDEETVESVYVDPSTGKILNEEELEFDGDVAYIKDKEGILIEDCMEEDFDGTLDSCLGV